MSLALAAQHLQAQGRGNDKHLVHMTTGELQSLQKLAEQHGGSLTINPKTGLPEAGFLSAVLPMAAGVVGSAIFGPEMLPLIAGGVGLADYAMTGSLMQGLMAGFGAYSGGKFGEDITAFGAPPPAEVPAPSITAPADVVSQATTQIPTQGIQLPALSQGQSVLDQSYLDTLKSAGTAQGIPTQALQTGNAQLTSMPNFGIQAAPAFGGPGLSTLGSGFQNVLAHPIDFLSQKGVGMDTAKALAPLALTAIGDIMKQTPAGTPVATTQKNPMNLKYNSPDFQGTFPTPPNPPYKPVYPNYVTNPYNPYAVSTSASGGLQAVKMAKGDLTNVLSGYQEMEEGLAGMKRPLMDLPTAGPGIYHDPEQGMDTATPLDRAHALWALASKHMPKKQAALMTQKQKAGLGSIPTQTAAEMQAEADAQAAKSIAQDSTPTSSKEGGLQNLGHYSDGGHLLKGPGDGVSDSIPATIGGKQPARLAEGEFVIPARIVSELGNGSTDAGAKRLYAMMDRIKAKRAKAKDIAADTKAYQYLPA